VIASISQRGWPSWLFVGGGGSGWLDDTAAKTAGYWYRRTSNRWLTLLNFVGSQTCLLIKLLTARHLPRESVVYVNTLLPFGAAIFGRLTGRRVVYHLHEISISPPPLRWALAWIARVTASHLIYVSDAHRAALPFDSIPATTVYNSLPLEFASRAAQNEYRHRRDSRFNVLMLASLRDYKGVPEYVALAKRFQSRIDVRFELVANDDPVAIRRCFAQHDCPPNLIIHAQTDDPAAHYARASLVVNLSRTDQWVETFGLTLLEAMAFGIPVIAPPVGGPAELICDGREGFLVDSRDQEALTARVRLLCEDEALCVRLSSAARTRAASFSAEGFSTALVSTLESIQATPRHT
jgi:L-malate glycosyltransferase